MIALAAALCVLHAAGQLPDHACSPGDNLDAVTQRNVNTTICQPGWATAHRHVTPATRTRIYAEYGLTGPHPFPEWEIDHIISLELGGSNSPRNLFPQHHPSRKDRLENHLHHRVCAHTMRLTTAQHGIARNWIVLADHEHIAAT